jgi:Spy/CpxP family protein refolding chaperone
MSSRESLACVVTFSHAIRLLRYKSIAEFDSANDQITDSRRIIMKLTKAIVSSVLIAGSVVACGSAFAQDSTNAPVPAVSTNGLPATTQGKHHGASVDMMMQNLNLTDDQKTQVQPILEAERQKMRDLRNDSSLSSDDRKAKMKEIRKDTATQLQPILTPDQFAQWKSMGHSHHSQPMQPASTNAPAAQ